jgi:UDP-glucose 4-epimerase
MNIKKILVTGGTGFIGSHLAHKLVALKYKVMVVDIMKDVGGIPYINNETKFLRGDITSEKTINKIKKWKPDVIFHLAAQSSSETSYENPKFDYLTNGYGTYLLCELAKRINLKIFIYTSSTAVYGSNKNRKITENSKKNPDSLYGLSKFIGEMFVNFSLKNTDTKTYIFRVFNTFGPGENLNYLKKGMVKIYSSYIWKKKPILIKGSLKRFRNFNYIDDVVDILIKSLSNKKLKKNEIFNLTSGKKYKVGELIKKILKVNSIKDYKIINKDNTKGDSFGFHASGSYLRKKFKNLTFLSLEEGLKKYFLWINSLPQKKNLKNYHPLRNYVKKNF